MTTKGAQPRVDQLIAAIARRQYGVISRWQLIAIGVGPEGIARRIRSGRLHRLHRGVYAVGHESLRGEAYWIAAVLAAGPGAVLSHASAAALWGLRPSASALVDVTVPTRSGRTRRQKIRIHRSGHLPPDEVTRRLGIPVTTVARTLLDLADAVSTQQTKRALDEAEHLGLLYLTSLRAVVHANPGRRGATVLTLAGARPERTRSPLEDRFLELIERNGLPRPLANEFVAGREADFVWPTQKLIVETDGGGAHLTRAAFEADRLRDRANLRAGYSTIRLTDRALDDELAVVADLKARLRPAG
jgi:Transcriptional regulator, AbiEi antitoxin